MASTVNMSAFPFNSVNGDRTYNANDWTKYFSQFIGNGVFPNPSSNLQVVTATGLKVTVKKGACFINGVCGFIDADTQLDISPGNGTYPRYDRVVVRLDINTRTVSLVVIEGTPSANPQLPAVTRNATIYDLLIANISVFKGATNIQQANIRDTRLHKGVCGVVTGLIEQVDTTQLYNDMTTFMSYVKSTLQAEWQDWVNANKNIFKNADPGAAITAEITDAREGAVSIKENLDKNYVKNGTYGIGGICPDYVNTNHLLKTGIYDLNDRAIINAVIKKGAGNYSARIGINTVSNRIEKYNPNNGKYTNLLDEENNLKLIEQKRNEYGVNGVIRLANNIKIITAVVLASPPPGGSYSYGIGTWELSADQQFSQPIAISATALHQDCGSSVACEWKNGKVTKIYVGYNNRVTYNVTFSVMAIVID